VQEALNNTAKHAGASRVSVCLEGMSGAVHLSLEDNGTGFERSSLRSIQGLGLASMRERVDLIGGALTIDSSQGGGTRIRVVVPFVKETDPE
jgi:two-component system sensor histidine kinase UhpB